MRIHSFVLPFAATAAFATLTPHTARAHCDTLDGPVVADARVALDSGNVTPVLKWVRPGQETEIRRTFTQTLRVRGLGLEAQTLADRFFFETLVRVHREGEGAPYTGLKPAGIALDPTIEASDAALETGDVEPLIERVTGHAEQGLRARFERARQAREHASQSVDEGREYVAAYVDFVHYAEGLVAAARRAAHGAHEAVPSVDDQDGPSPHLH